MRGLFWMLAVCWVCISAVPAAEAPRTVIRKEVPPHDFMRSKDVPELLQFLTNDDSVLRASAARELGRRKAPEAVKPLKDLLNHEMVDFVRLDAATTVLDLGDQSASAVLHDLLKSKAMFVSAQAAGALAAHGDDSGLDVARAQLSSPFLGTRTEAIKAIGSSRNDSVAYPVLEAALKDKEPSVRSAAVYKIAERGTKRAFDLIKTVIADPERRVRVSALTALAAAKSRKAIPGLLDALADPDGGIRSYASGALSSITGVSRPAHWLLDAEKAKKMEREWRAWWEANKDKPDPPADKPEAGTP